MNSKSPSKDQERNKSPSTGSMLKNLFTKKFSLKMGGSSSSSNLKSSSPVQKEEIKTNKFKPSKDVKPKINTGLSSYYPEGAHKS